MVGGSLRVLPASSTTKTGRHDIAEILLNVALSTKNHQSVKVSRWLAMYFHLFVRYNCEALHPKLKS